MRLLYRSAVSFTYQWRVSGGGPVYPPRHGSFVVETGQSVTTEYTPRDVPTWVAYFAQPEWRGPYSVTTLRALDNGEAVVPPLWPYEVANGLLMGERRRRITPTDTVRSLGLLSRPPHSHRHHQP